MPFSWELDRPWRQKMTKGIPKKPGVYLIECSATGNRYIGASVNLYRRVFNHLQDMAISELHSSMAGDYLKYGKETFSVTILEIVKERRNLQEREAYWMNKLTTEDNAYNSEASKQNRFWC